MHDEFKEYVLKIMDEGKRIDGRDFLEYRKPFTVEFGISKTAEGSAKVQLGRTLVLAGVKLSIGQPYPDTPDRGNIMVDAQFLPLAHKGFESGPPGIGSIEVARVVDRGIREAKAIDLKGMCIEVGEKVWNVSIDIVIINHDGNLLDASGMAALAALKDTKFPSYNGTTLDYKKRTDKSLPLLKEPLPVTVYRIGDKFIVDPEFREEESYDARLTITASEEGIISALQKGGDTPLTLDDIGKMVDIGLERANFLRKNVLAKQIGSKNR